MITVEKPKFAKTEAYLEELKKFDPSDLLHQFGKMGVSELAANTPVDTGETAQGWSYKVTGGGDRYKLIWYNNVMAGRTPLVLLLQYGHMTKSGWFLSGRDFINPALKPVYDGFVKAIGQEIFV